MYTLSKHASTNQATPAVSLVNIYNSQKPDLATYTGNLASVHQCEEDQRSRGPEETRGPEEQGTRGDQRTRGAGLLLKRGLVHHRDKGRGQPWCLQRHDRCSSLESRRRAWFRLTRGRLCSSPTAMLLLLASSWCLGTISTSSSLAYGVTCMQTHLRELQLPAPAET